MTTALIAEDEPLLAAALQAELARAWPALRIVAQVGDGASAVREALALRPQVLFLDIRMPGMTGLEAAAELAEEWPHDSPFPALVFVTAYDQYAVQAFEAQAVDYVLKPVVPERLARTAQRLQQRLGEQASAAPVAATARRSSTAWYGLGGNFSTSPRTRPLPTGVSVISQVSIRTASYFSSGGTATVNSLAWFSPM